MVGERRLGRGLGSLLGAGNVESPEPPRTEVRVAEIRPNPHQPRRIFDPAALEELAASIRRHGVLQPVVLREAAPGFELISGERRLRAAKQAGLERVPAVVLHGVSDEQMLELALVENVQRADLDAIEKARGYAQMVDRLGLTQDQVAERVGLKRSTVANHLRLLELPEEVQRAVSEGLLSMGHARALLGMEPRSRLLELVERIVLEDLSVRAVEQIVREGAGKRSKAAADKPAKESERPPWLVELEGRMRDHLGAKVSLIHQAGYRGKIVIDYFDQDDLERLAGLLAPRPRL